jgi:hypothetical protein
MRVGSCLVVQRSWAVVEAVAGRQGRNYAAPVRIQEEEEGDMLADHRRCAEARILVAVGGGKAEGLVDHDICVVVEAEAELVRDSIAALDDSRGRRWVEPSRSQAEAASGGTLLGCETLVAEAAVGILREVAIRREFVMRDQHRALPSTLRFDLLGEEGIALERQWEEKRSARRAEMGAQHYVSAPPAGLDSQRNEK